MKLPLTLLIALLAVPIAQAAPEGATVDAQTDTIRRDASGLRVTEAIEFTVTDAARYNANATWTVYVPGGAPEPAANLTRGATTSTVPADRVNATSGAPAGHQAYAISLAGLAANAQANERFTLSLQYDLPGATYRHRLASAAATLTVSAEPGPGYEATAQGVTLTRSGASYTATVANAAAGTEYAVTFQAAAGSRAAEAAPLDKYVWGLGGLGVGLLAAVYAARQGWLGSAKAKRFEKGGQMESRETLEARRRTLMAALKELEVGHEAKEIPDAAYAPLKEEYKAQAVRVLRTLEEKKEPPRT